MSCNHKVDYRHTGVLANQDSLDKQAGLASCNQPLRLTRTKTNNIPQIDES